MMMPLNRSAIAAIVLLVSAILAVPTIAPPSPGPRRDLS